MESRPEGTVLNIEVAYSVPIPVLGRLAQRLAAKQNTASFELALVNVKNLMEASNE